MNFRRQRYPQGPIIGTLEPVYKVKKIREGMTSRSFFFNWLFITISSAIFLILVSFSMAIVLGSDLSTFFIAPLFLTAVFFIFLPIVIPIFYLRTYLVYSLGDGYITIRNGGFIPFMGKVVFIDDITATRRYRSLLIANIYFGRERPYFNNSFAPRFQDSVYLIDLKMDHKIIQNRNIMRRPEPPGRFKKYIMRMWYPDRIAVPEHIIKRYIDEGLKGSKRLKVLIGE
ncbi:MAG: hypothetical protein ACMUHM_05665 [Thermoplasmatota archaeon]